MLEVMLRITRYGGDFFDESEEKEREGIGVICALLGDMRENPMIKMGIKGIYNNNSNCIVTVPSDQDV